MPKNVKPGWSQHLPGHSRIKPYDEYKAELERLPPNMNTCDRIDMFGWPLVCPPPVARWWEKTFGR